MKPWTPLLLAPLLTLAMIAPPANAKVFRCVNADGSIAFRDTACEQIGTRQEVKIHAAPKSARRGGGSLTKEQMDERFGEAQAACDEGLVPFLQARRADFQGKMSGAVVGIANRHIRKGFSEIKYMGEVKYVEGPTSMRTEVECTATQEGAGEWQVEYYEGVTHSYIQFE